MKKCPFCSEEILDTAKKCKHCNEWLDNKKDSTDGSAAARAVSKGIKQKELQDFSLGLTGAGALLFACFMGYVFKNLWVGIIIFFVLMVSITRKYYKE